MLQSMFGHILPFDEEKCIIPMEQWLYILDALIIIRLLIKLQKYVLIPIVVNAIFDNLAIEVYKYDRNITRKEIKLFRRRLQTTLQNSHQL